MRLVGTEAEAYLDPSATDRDWPSRAVALDHQARATQVLEREYGSWTRLAAGTAAVGLLGAGLAALGLGVALAADDETSASEGFVLAGIGVVLAVVLILPGRRLGRATVHAGRRVVDALVRWHRLPEAVAPDGSFVPPELRRRIDAIDDRDRRRIFVRDAVLARAYVFRGPLFVRIVAAALLLLIVLAAWGIAVRVLVVAEGAFEYAAALTLAAMAVVPTAAMIYVWGGAFRVNAAHARREPVSSAIVHRARQLFRRAP